jgi:hypothetical protein
MTPNRLVVLIVFLLLCGCGAHKSRLDRHTTAIFSGATKVEVFRVDGLDKSPNGKPINPGDPTVGGYPILARGKNQSSEFATKLADVLADDKTYTDVYNKCFYPGVAFRVWKGEESVDVLICFRCENFYVGPSTDQQVLETGSFLRSPNANRLVRLAKEAFPDDEEVQALKEK